MIAEQPRHGYELMKEIAERTGGGYAPSPGVIYPTLSWLDDMGYIRLEAEDGGRKRYGITAEGQAFLLANRAAVDALLSRIGPVGVCGDRRLPEPLVEGMETLKRALRLRLQQGPIDQAAAESVSAALHAAARVVEQS